MPRYYCDYCDTYLTHDSPSVRKQHNAGYKHKANVRTYYQQFEEQQTQSLIDQRIKEHLSGQAAFGQIGAAYAAWRPGVRPPILPAPLPIPGAMPPGAPMVPGVRLPVLPRPPGLPVYGTAPLPAPIPGQPGAPIPGQPGAQIPGQPGAPIPGQPGAPIPGQPGGPNPGQPGGPNPGQPGQTNGPPGPPPMNAPPTSAPGANAAGSNGVPPTGSQPMYQGNPGGANFGGTNLPGPPSFPSAGNPAYPPTSGAESFNYGQAPNTNHQSH